MRVSLGAGRFRMVWQALTDAAPGLDRRALGLVDARFGATILTRIMTSGTQSLGPPLRLEIPLDARVLTFTIGVTAGGARLRARAPLSSRSCPRRRWRCDRGRHRRNPDGSSARPGSPGRDLLALSSVSQLYIGHLRHLRDRSLGFDRDGVLLMSVNTSRAENREQLAALYRDVVARLHAIPGVDSVAASGITPMSGAAGSAFLRVEGSTSLRTTGCVCPSIPCRRTISSRTACYPRRTRLSRLRHG